MTTHPKKTIISRTPGRLQTIATGHAYIYHGDSVIGIAAQGDILFPERILNLELPEPIYRPDVSTTVENSEWAQSIDIWNQSAVQVQNMFRFTADMLSIRGQKVIDRLRYALKWLALQKIAITHPQGMQYKVSRIRLAEMVGCSREMVGREMVRLEEKGEIMAAGKTIVHCQHRAVAA